MRSPFCFKIVFRLNHPNGGLLCSGYQFRARPQGDRADRTNGLAEPAAHTVAGRAQIWISLQVAPAGRVVQVETAHRANRDTQPAGNTGPLVDHRREPVRPPDPDRCLPVRCLYSGIRADPAAGAALDATLWMDDMHLMPFACDRFGWAGPHAGPASLTVGCDRVSHVMLPCLL